MSFKPPVLAYIALLLGPLAALHTASGFAASVAVEQLHCDIPRLSDSDAFNYIIGTQTFSPAYQFTKETRLVETAEAIRALGCSVIKFELARRYARPDGNVPTPTAGIDSLMKLARDEPSHRKVLDMPFAHFVLWAHTFAEGTANWRHGMAKFAQEAESREMYDLTRHLLTTY